MNCISGDTHNDRIKADGAAGRALNDTLCDWRTPLKPECILLLQLHSLSVKVVLRGERNDKDRASNISSKRTNETVGT